MANDGVVGAPGLTAKATVAVVPQLLPAFTVILPPVLPKLTVILFVPCPAVKVAVPGTVQV